MLASYASSLQYLPSVPCSSAMKLTPTSLHARSVPRRAVILSMWSLTCDPLTDVVGMLKSYRVDHPVRWGDQAALEGKDKGVAPRLGYGASLLLCLWLATVIVLSLPAEAPARTDLRYPIYTNNTTETKTSLIIEYLTLLIFTVSTLCGVL